MNERVPFTVIPELVSSSWEEAIHEMIARSSCPCREEAEKAVLKREKEASTAIGDGVAVPHARLSDLENMVVVLGISKGGIDMGGDKVHIFLLTLIPQNAASTHVDFLSYAVKVLSSEQNRERIMDAEREEDVLEVFHV